MFCHPDANGTRLLPNLRIALRGLHYTFFPTALATLADDSGEVAVDELCTVVRPITRRGPAPKTPRIHYLETSSNWPNLRWLLLTMRFDIVHSSRYLNSIDVGRSIPRAASILKRLPIL